MTQKEIAKQAGVGKAYISQMESGRKLGSVTVLRKIAKALSLDIDDLLRQKRRSKGLDLATGRE